MNELWIKIVAGVVATLLCSAMTFTAKFTYEQSINMAHMTDKMETVSGQISDLRIQVQAMSNNYVRTDQFQDHETRIRALEAKAHK